jgi:hypothetical protein
MFSLSADFFRTLIFFSFFQNIYLILLFLGVFYGSKKISNIKYQLLDRFCLTILLSLNQTYITYI